MYTQRVRSPAGFVMFFLIRCIFWLGLVFVALPWNGEEVGSALADQAEEIGRAATDKAQALCLKDPVACANHAATAARLLGGTTPTSASASQNTLLPSDLAPAWRGATHKAGATPSGTSANMPPRRSPG